MLSARKQLLATVKSVSPGDAATDVVMDVQGIEVVATISRHPAGSPILHAGKS